MVELVTTTDHKQIGYLYLVAAFGFFLLAGVLALLMRAELFSPGMQVFASKDGYNQAFTLHGTIMMLLFATPTFAGFANAVMPLQIGAPDVAFPRLNALSFWMFLFGGLIVVSGLVLPGGAAAFGWFAYAPLSGATYSPGAGGDLWVAGLILSGFGTILGAVNFIATIVCLRAPGLTMWRRCSSRPPGVRCCGSTCSGSSATPRCTSSRCRSSASSRRCCRCSPASRCSATGGSSSPPSRSARCRWRCGRTTCSPPGRSPCRSSP